jgi:hypothetical protein
MKRRDLCLIIFSLRRQEKEIVLISGYFGVWRTAVSGVSNRTRHHQACVRAQQTHYHYQYYRPDVGDLKLVYTADFVYFNESCRVVR